jgi:hypothetical protein
VADGYAFFAVRSLRRLNAAITREGRRSSGVTRGFGWHRDTVGYASLRAEWAKPGNGSVGHEPDPHAALRSNSIGAPVMLDRRGRAG